jgi:effector-binding domain-containing protein
MAEISIKFLMPIKIASTEKKGPREEMGKIIGQISQALREKKVKVAGPAMALLHDDPKGIDFQKANLEFCLPISGKVKGAGEVKDRELEKGAFASITHSGPLEMLPQAYQAILKWIEENGYKIAGPGREIYHKGLGEAGKEHLIEFQFPVRK